MIRGVLAVALLAGGAWLVSASLPTRTAESAESVARDSRLVSAAKQFLATLPAEKRAKAVFEFNSDERMNWHFVPKVRGGLPYKEMDEVQQRAAVELLKTSLSAGGFKKIAVIRELEKVLHVIEQGRGPARDTELYYFAFFGEPSESGVWGWRYEGHHVSLNWTSIKGKVIASTPQFLGSNPGEVRDGPMKGTRVLAVEEDLGRALVKSLTSDQSKKAIIGDKAPADILTANKRETGLLEEEGIFYSSLTQDQQGMLITLIREYANVQRPEMAKSRLDKIKKAGIDKVRFAWMGGLEKGEGHYYRIQGPTFLIEYDNTQNNANHIHTAWRDFKGDFGRDLIAEHYKSASHDHGHDHPHDH
jgi:hypothetical protein